MLKRDFVISRLISDGQNLQGLHLRRIGLFGSTARGTNHKHSDLDFLIEYENGFKDYKNFMKVTDYLEAAFGENIDVVTRESLTPYLYDTMTKDIQYVQVID